MTQRTLHRGFCIDTSALIDLWRRFYSPDVFPSLWDDLKKIIDQGLLVAPKEVLEELESYHDKKDPLLIWAKTHKKMFIELDKDQQKLTRDILLLFPKLVDEKKSTPQADPFVIALALSRNWIVVTAEQPANLGNHHEARPKIPNVCEYYNVDCIYHLLDFFREHQWKY